MVNFLNLLNRLKKIDFIRNVFILASGAVIAQFLTIIISPLLTRIYSPEDFGIFSFYVSIISVISVIVSLRFEVSILLPKKESDAISLVWVSFIITIIISFISFLIFWMLQERISAYFKIDYFSELIYFIPVMVLLTGFYNTLKYWNIRQQNYKRTSNSVVANSLSLNTTQVILGLLNLGYSGLIIGKIFGQFFSFLIMLIQVLRDDFKKLKRHLNFTNLKTNFLNYKEFPLYGMPQALFNSLSMNLIPILMLMFFSSALVGIYALAVRVLLVPVNILGNTFKDVFIQKATSIINDDKNIGPFYNKSIALIAVLFFPLILLFLFFGERIFSIVFGSEWILAGEISKWIVLWIYFILISRPVVALLQVLKKQKEYLILEVIGFCIKIIIFSVSAYFTRNFEFTIALFALSNVIHYILLFFVVKKFLPSN